MTGAIDTETMMGLCVIGDYGTKSGRGKGGVYSVPAIVT